MAKILVTGGCGFIGSHLVDALIARGDQPIVLDDFSTGKRQNIGTEVPVIKGSVLDPVCVHRAMQGVDAVVHLAAVTSVQKCNEEWGDSHAVNVTGTVRVFEAAHAHGGVPVVYASSASVYGNVQDLPISESTPARPLTAYGVDKYGCELHAGVAGRIYGVPSMRVRIFNAYGLRQEALSPYSGVISIFADRMKRGEPVTIFGDGSQQRDFIHVSDVVAHLLAAIDHASVEAPVYNVCTGTGTSISELVETLRAITGSGSAVTMAEGRRGDIRHSVGDPVLASRQLAVRAQVMLRDGLVQLVGA